MKFRDFDNYDISSDGKILNIKRHKVLNPTLDGSGYPQTKLYKNGIAYSFKVHKIVYITFNGDIPKGYEIDHINGDKTDNRLENLRCVTHKTNCDNPVTFQKFLKAIKTEEYIKKHRENSDKKKGIKLSDEIKKKMSEAHKGKCPPKYVLEAAMEAKSKKVYQYTLDGKLVREYCPLKSVEDYGYSRFALSAHLNGRRNTYRGYKWTYEPLKC